MSFRTSSVLIATAVVLAIVASAGAGTVGINYGRKADNLPPASKVVQLIKSQGINKLKLYDADPAALHAFSGTDIKITIDLPNEELSNVARRLSRAYAWVQKNVVAYVPGTQITAIAVGNEVFANSNDLTSYLVKMSEDAGKEKEKGPQSSAPAPIPDSELPQLDRIQLDAPNLKRKASALSNQPLDSTQRTQQQYWQSNKRSKRG